MSPETKPEEAEAYGDYLAARYAALNNDPAEAATRYVRTLERQPQNSEVLEKAVYQLLLGGDFGAAADLARPSRSQPVGVAPLARLVTAVDAYRNGEYDLTVALLQDKDLGEFNAALAHLLIAWSYAADGDIETALMRLTSDEGGFIHHFDGYSQAFVLAHVGQKQEALAILEIGWQTGLRLPIAAALQARLLLEQGREADARALLSEVDVDSASSTLLYDIKTRLDRGETAEPVSISADQGAAMSLIAPVATLTGNVDPDVAIAYLRILRALDSDLDGAAIMLADHLSRRGRAAAAVAELEAIKADSAYYNVAQVQLGWLCLRIDDRPCARAAMEAAATGAPSRAILVQVGDFYRAIEDYARAEEVFAAIALSDAEQGQSDWRILFALGVARERLGDWEQAERDLTAALEIEPNRPEVLNYLGYSWIDRGENIPAAFTLIRQAVAQRPDAGYIVDSLGWAYYRMGRFQEAVLYLERATELDPDDPVVNDHLGDAYWRIGRRDEARYQWRRVKLFDPDAQLLEDVDKKLKQGLHTQPPDAQDAGANDGETW